jgi:predicted HTH transcriptional regulator
MQGVSKLRNRVIGRVFHELHLIEQWGSGIQRMTAACQQAGLEPRRLEEIGMHFRVTFPAPGSLCQRATLSRLKSMTSRGLVEIVLNWRRKYGLNRDWRQLHNGIIPKAWCKVEPW